MQDEMVVVVAGGHAPRSDAALAVPAGAPIIAADGGLAHALTLGLEVETVVGDLDSVDDAVVAGASTAGVRVLRHPAAKDATDLELALDEALARRPQRILVLAGDGGRLDHLLGVLLLLASPRYASVAIDAEIGPARVHVIWSERLLSGAVGETLSLLASHGAAEGVWTEGLVYPLVGETLEPGSTRGVSNVFAAEEARVRVERGVLIAVRPGPEARASE
jgi:thiamine pyrophosphokinase